MVGSLIGYLCSHEDEKDSFIGLGIGTAAGILLSLLVCACTYRHDRQNNPQSYSQLALLQGSRPSSYGSLNNESN